MTTEVRTPSEQDLANALHWVGVGGNHLALIIGADHPSYLATEEEASAHYGSDLDKYNAWVCWKVIMHVSREVFDALPQGIRDESWEAFRRRRHDAAMAKVRGKRS